LGRKGGEALSTDEAIGNKCDICSLENISVEVKLWVKDHYRRYRMCKDYIATVKDFVRFGIVCRLELYTKGEPESNYMLTKDTIKDLYVKVNDKWQKR
jgi:hypothetical protein